MVSTPSTVSLPVIVSPVLRTNALESRPSRKSVLRFDTLVALPTVNGGDYVAVPRRDNFSLDVAAIEAVVAANPRARVLFLCSPNNPDGSVIGDAELRRLLDLPVLVILDEAYVEFAYTTSPALATATAVPSVALTVL